ncbi:hypothetical protein GF356_07940 [candidate division GN15 bacterium]|nr:hypothetical protein [candidate division GN15 bacterium]
MKSRRYLIISLFVLLISPVLGHAQTDYFGKIDTVFADIEKIDNQNWSVTISYSNDQPVVGLSIPLRLAAGENRIVGDSAIYTGGRVEHFDYKGFRADTAIQCVTMGMIANMGPEHKSLDAGFGRLVTFFVSSLDDKPIAELLIDTTTTHPSNSLMTVADRYQPTDDGIDTIVGERLSELSIKPAFVIRTSGK